MKSEQALFLILFPPVFSEFLESDVKMDLSSCLLSNMSICSTSQNNDKFVVAVYNPLAWKTTHYIRLPVKGGSYQINGPDGKYHFCASILV